MKEEIWIHPQNRVQEILKELIKKVERRGNNEATAYVYAVAIMEDIKKDYTLKECEK